MPCTCHLYDLQSDVHKQQFVPQDIDIVEQVEVCNEKLTQSFKESGLILSEGDDAQNMSMAGHVVTTECYFDSQGNQYRTRDAMLQFVEKSIDALTKLLMSVVPCACREASFLYILAAEYGHSEDGKQVDCEGCDACDILALSELLMSLEWTRWNMQLLDSDC